jgi:hypothetical protein
MLRCDDCRLMVDQSINTNPARPTRTHVSRNGRSFPNRVKECPTMEEMTCGVSDQKRSASLRPRQVDSSAVGWRLSKVSRRERYCCGSQTRAPTHTSFPSARFHSVGEICSWTIFHEASCFTKTNVPGVRLVMGVQLGTRGARPSSRRGGRERGPVLFFDNLHLSRSSRNASRR